MWFHVLGKVSDAGLARMARRAAALTRVSAHVVIIHRLNEVEGMNIVHIGRGLIVPGTHCAWVGRIVYGTHRPKNFLSGTHRSGTHRHGIPKH